MRVQSDQRCFSSVVADHRVATRPFSDRQVCFNSTKDVLIVPRTMFHGESDFEVRKIIGGADFEKNQLLYTSKWWPFFCQLGAN